MDLESIRLLYDYNRWVNRLLLARAAELSPEQTLQPFGVSFDSVHGTLGHILGAEIGWLSRWQGQPLARRPGGEDFEDLPAIQLRWEQHQRELDDFLESLSPERLSTPIRYQRQEGESYELPLGQMLLHVVNHGTHHRGELADMLTRLGYAPTKPTDLSRFCLERTNQL